MTRLINEILRSFGERLEKLAVPAYHYIVDPSARMPYIAWREAHESNVDYSDASERSIRVMIDLYTQREYDPIIDAIEIEFPDAFLSAVEFYMDTKVICHTFEVDVCG